MFTRFVSTNIITLMLLISFVSAPLLQQPTPAYAGGAFATEATQLKNTAESTINASANTFTTSLMAALHIKELTLDGIAYGLARTVIKSMVTSIVNWINSGFQGSPAFVTDLENYLVGAAEQAIADTIYGSELAFLCSPFQLDVQLALETQTYKRSTDSYQAQCTFDDIENNIDNFLQGSFTEGGWQNWFALTQGETNDPNKAYYEAQLVLDAKIRNAQGQEIKLLDFGDGFLSYKVCSDTQEQSGTQRNCDITTPGRVISDQLNKALGAGQDQLIEADEINEIIGALIAQLAQQALTGVYGLLGLGGSSSYSDTRYGDNADESYLSAVNNETVRIGDADDIINTALAREISEEIRSDLASVNQTVAAAYEQFNAVRTEMDAIEASVREAFAATSRPDPGYTCSIPAYTDYVSPAEINFFEGTVGNLNAVTIVYQRVFNTTPEISFGEADIDPATTPTDTNAINAALASSIRASQSNPASETDFTALYTLFITPSPSAEADDVFPTRIAGWYKQGIWHDAQLQLFNDIVDELDRRFASAVDVEEQAQILELHTAVNDAFTIPTVAEQGRIDGNTTFVTNENTDLALYSDILDDALLTCLNQAPDPNNIGN